MQGRVVIGNGICSNSEGMGEGEAIVRVMNTAES